MSPTNKTTNDIVNALAAAKKSPGWNNRSPDIHMYDLGDCILYVVPYRRWAWRRHEKQFRKRAEQ